MTCGLKFRNLPANTEWRKNERDHFSRTRTNANFCGIVVVAVFQATTTISGKMFLLSFNQNSSWLIGLTPKKAARFLGQLAFIVITFLLIHYVKCLNRLEWGAAPERQT
jgi:hypothetical protein